MTEREDITFTELLRVARFLRTTEVLIDRNGRLWFENPQNHRIYAGYDLVANRRMNDV